MTDPNPVSLFAAFADSTRLRLIQILANQPAGAALCVKGLAMRLEVSQPAVSQHLRVLRNVGLVHPVRWGQRVHYYLDRERIAWLQRYLGELRDEDHPTGECPWQKSAS